MTNEAINTTMKMHASNASRFWVSGWQRKWMKRHVKADDSSRVWKRLLAAESRYQLEYGFSIYSELL